MFNPTLYALVLNQAFKLTGASEATAQKLIDADQNTIRLVKKTEAFFRVLPPAAPEFSHFTPANWVFQHPDLLDGNALEPVETLERAERVISALNRIVT